MTPERHQKIQQIFEAALGLPMEGRTAFLAEACGSDSELRSRVARLLEADEGAVATDETETISDAGVKECSTCSRCYEGSTLTCSYDGTPLDLGVAGRLVIDGKYFIERRLGRGGMGSVYLVKHLGLEKRFALKMILAGKVSSKISRQSFETEARALGLLKHPNIVDVTDYGVDQNAGSLPYLVMEYLEGRSLSQILHDRSTLPFQEAIALLESVADAIDTAHAQNIVHGDLKPPNLFLARQVDSREVVKVVDFGLATLPVLQDSNIGKGKDPASDCGTTGSIRGTLAYMAPELLRSEPASPASDRFALGVLAYELLTGQVPFGRYFLEVSKNQQAVPIAPSVRNPELPKELDRPLLALLNPIAEQRPPSASAAVSEMRKAWLLAEQRKWRAREVPRRWLFSAIASVLVLLLAGILARVNLLESWEERLVDARFAMVGKHAPDSRVLLVSLDEASIAEDRRPLADRSWADEFGGRLDSVFAGGAVAVAIDLLMPETWSQSVQFGNSVSSHADRLLLGAFSAPSGEVIGMTCVSPLTAHLLGSERYRNLFAFVNLQEDQDRTIRHTRMAYVDRDGKTRDAFAARAAKLASFGPAIEAWPKSPVWIDYSTRLADLAKVSWKNLMPTLARSPDLFRGKLVIIGAEIQGFGDLNRIPLASGLVAGVMVQSVIVDTISSGFPIRGWSLASCLSAVGLLCFATIALMLRFPHRMVSVLVPAILACLGYVVFAFCIFRSSKIMLSVVGPEFAMVLSIIVGVWLKSKLSPYPLLEQAEQKR